MADFVQNGKIDVLGQCELKKKVVGQNVQTWRVLLDSTWKLHVYSTWKK